MSWRRIRSADYACRFQRHADHRCGALRPPRIPIRREARHGTLPAHPEVIVSAQPRHVRAGCASSLRRSGRAPTSPDSRRTLENGVPSAFRAARPPSARRRSRRRNDGAAGRRHRTARSGLCHPTGHPGVSPGGAVLGFTGYSEGPPPGAHPPSARRRPRHRNAGGGRRNGPQASGGAMRAMPNPRTRASGSIADATGVNLWPERPARSSAAPLPMEGRTHLMLFAQGRRKARHRSRRREPGTSSASAHLTRLNPPPPCARARSPSITALEVKPSPVRSVPAKTVFLLLASCTQEESPKRAPFTVPCTSRDLRLMSAGRVGMRYGRSKSSA
jgi:hypothetical protein